MRNRCLYIREADYNARLGANYDFKADLRIITRLLANPIVWDARLQSNDERFCHLEGTSCISLGACQASEPHLPGFKC